MIIYYQAADKYVDAVYSDGTRKITDYASLVDVERILGDDVERISRGLVIVKKAVEARDIHRVRVGDTWLKIARRKQKRNKDLEAAVLELCDEFDPEMLGRYDAATALNIIMWWVASVKSVASKGC